MCSADDIRAHAAAAVRAAFASLPGEGGGDDQRRGVGRHGTKSGKFPSEMHAWKQLSDTDSAAVITFTRNSWSNKATENIVQPAEVVAARK